MHNKKIIHLSVVKYALPKTEAQEEMIDLEIFFTHKALSVVLPALGIGSLTSTKQKNL